MTHPCPASGPDPVRTCDPTSMLTAMAEVRGQLNTIMALLHSQHEATGRRIDDMRANIDTRLQGIDNRLSVVEGHERGTAIRTAGIGATSGGLVAAGVELARYLLNLKGHG